MKTCSARKTARRKPQQSEPEQWVRDRARPVIRKSLWPARQPAGNQGSAVMGRNGFIADIRNDHRLETFRGADAHFIIQTFANQRPGQG